MVNMLSGPQFNQNQGGLLKLLQAWDLYNTTMGSRPPQELTPEMRGPTGSLEKVLGQEDIAAGGKGLPQMTQGMNLMDWLKTFTTGAGFNPQPGSAPRTRTPLLPAPQFKEGGGSGALGDVLGLVLSLFV